MQGAGAVEGGHFKDQRWVKVGVVFVKKTHFIEDAEGVVAGEAVGTQADIDVAFEHLFKGVVLMAEEMVSAGAEGNGMIGGG